MILSIQFTNAQSNLLFKSGTVIPINNIDELLLSSSNVYNTNEVINGHYYRIIQFAQTPTQQQKEILKNNGIVLLNYLPTKAFYAAIQTTANLNVLQDVDAVAFMEVKSHFKLTHNLKTNNYPHWTLAPNNKIDINALFYEDLTLSQVLNFLQTENVEVLRINQHQVAQLRIDLNDLNKIYQLPYFYYFEELSEPEQPENLVGRTDHRSNAIAQDYYSGLHFDGTGVNIMMQDDGFIGPHIDYQGRITHRGTVTNIGDHGDHVAGTIMGAGNLNPIARGMSFGAHLFVFSSTDVNYDSVPNLYNNDGVVITSKSYSNGCNAGYTTLTRQLDQQIRQMPNLIHVFSAGNSGTSNCGYGAGSGWGNITGGHKVGKNVIATGNLDYIENLATSSSRGPAHDGRIKPDICAVGTNVYSTVDVNTYSYKTGTSMSCPGIAGSLGQIYEAYKTLNGGSNPPSGLIKAAALNTAEDLGNVGPDYKHGWGRINVRKMYETILNNNYLNSNVSQGASNNHNITVPGGLSQVKIMVYWHDYEATASTNKALVNDINMLVTDPNATSHGTWLLDPTPNPSNLNTPATIGVDDLNNMEQVVINNPVAGTYTVNINGFNIPQGPQTYYIVYEFVGSEVVLTYPLGGEGFVPGETETIRWDAFGSSGTFTLEYTLNNGITWNTISSSIGANTNYYNWTVPTALTGEAKIRITRGASSDESDQPFSIIDVPSGLTIDWACPDSMRLSWNAVSGATAYEASMLGNKYMDSVGVTTNTYFVYHGINPLNTYWVSVKAHGPNNAVGRRAIAIEKSPGNVNCTINFDAGMYNSVPSNGSTYPDCAFNPMSVSVTIENEGQNALTNIPVHYQLNGGAIINETYTGTINAGNNASYVFTNTATPVIGNNSLKIWVTYPGDGNSYNDTLDVQFTLTSASPLTLPIIENFETFANCGTSSDCEATTCNLNNNWVNETNTVADDIDWRTDDFGTPSNNTGPTQDYNPGTSSGNYLYTEASGGCNQQQANLISPCIDLTNVTNPTLTFAYHMDGADMGSLHVDVLSNGVWTNDVTPSISGDKGANWLTRVVSLNTYVGGIINVRFRGITGNGYRSDLAIDDIRFDGTVGVNDNMSLTNMNIYPNPSNGMFNYTYNGEETITLSIVDVSGKLVKTIYLNSNSTGVIDLSNQSKGVYYIKAQSNQTFEVIKLINL